MTRTRRFVGGISLGYLSMALMTVVGLWLTPFLLARIGTHDYGLWLIAAQVLGYLALMDFGVVALAPREAAYATGRMLGGAEDDLVPTFARFRTIVRWQVPLAAIACVLTWWGISGRWEELRWPLAVTLGAFLVLFPFRLHQATLQGLQDLAFLGKVQLAAWSAGSMVTILLVFAHAGLAALAAGWVVTQAGVATACTLRLRRRFASVSNVESPPVTWPVARELFKRSGWISLAQVGQVFLSGSDILLLGAILGPAAAVPYACTAKLITFLSHHPQLLMQTAAPAIAELRTSASRDRQATVTLALARAVLIISGGVACVVLAINEAFVTWWVGPHQFGGMALTVLLTAAMLARHFATSMIYTLFAFGYERRISVTALCDGLVTVTVTAALASSTPLGAVSAAIGSLAGVLLVTLPLYASALASQLQVSVGRLLASTAEWAVRFAAATTISLAGSRLIDGHSFGVVLALAVGAGLVYCAAMWRLVMEPPLGEYVRTGVSFLAGNFGTRRRVAVDPRP